VLRIGCEAEAKAATKKRRTPKKKTISVESSADDKYEVLKKSGDKFYMLPVTRGRRVVFSNVEV
jgi:hypothetical protein